MKILFITSSSINGGAQKHISEMFKSLSELGHDMYLVAPNGWLTEELRDYGDKIIAMNLDQKNTSKLVRIIDQVHPEITNTFILSGGVFGTLAWIKRKYGKIFITVNNPVIYPGISKKGKLVYPWMYRWMSKYASAFLVKADRVRDEVDDVIRHRKPVISIKNGIDFTVFDKDKDYPDIRLELGIQTSDIVIANVAALNERKGQQYLIDAAIELRRKYPIHVLLVGEGDDDKRLKNMTKEKDAEEYIHFLGRRSDINTVLANSNIFVLSSLHEGLPNALMEAMAMGLACVATDVGGVRQLIDDNDKGIVIQPESTKEIRSAIEKICMDHEFYSQIKKGAFNKICNEYKQETVVKELVEIYEKY